MNEVNQYQADNGKYEIEGQVILAYKINLERRLNEMREVFDRNCSQTG